MDDMISASNYEEVKEVSRSTIVQHLTNAKQCIFTVTFRKKIDPKDIEARLTKITKESELKDKALAKELSEGKQVTLTCYKTKSQNLQLISPANVPVQTTDHCVAQQVAQMHRP